MDNSSSKKKLILLGVVAVVICVLFFVLAVSRMNSSSPELSAGNNAEPVFFPESETIDPVDFQGEVTEPVLTPPVRQETQVSPDSLTPWQTETIDYRTQSENAPIARVENESPFSIDDLSHLDLGFNTEPEVVPAPIVPSEALLPPPTSTYAPPVVVEETVIEYPSMRRERYRDCGEITMPTGFGIAFFSLSAQNYPEVICLGEAVASSGCGSNSATILSEGEEVGTVFVARRSDDGVCSVGAPLSEELATFCSVEKLMDIGTGEDKTMSQWRADFGEDPGGLFADLYFKNSSAFDNPNAFEEYDCKVYEI